jgi:hypothetical protein
MNASTPAAAAAALLLLLLPPPPLPLLPLLLPPPLLLLFLWLAGEGGLKREVGEQGEVCMPAARPTVLIRR